MIGRIDSAIWTLDDQTGTFASKWVSNFLAADRKIYQGIYIDDHGMILLYYQKISRSIRVYSAQSFMFDSHYRVGTRFTAWIYNMEDTVATAIVKT